MLHWRGALRAATAEACCESPPGIPGESTDDRCRWFGCGLRPKGRNLQTAGELKVPGTVAQDGALSYTRIRNSGNPPSHLSGRLEVPAPDLGSVEPGFPFL